MALTTLATLKQYRGITDTAHDAELTRLQGVVEAWLAQQTARALEPTTVTEYHSLRPGQSTVFLRRPPVQSITTLHDDPDRQYGSGTLLTAGTDYVLEDGPAGIVRFIEHTTSGGIQNLKAVYTAGYADTSAERKLLEQLVIELVWLTRDLGDRALLGVQSKHIADGTITVFDRSRLEQVRELLALFTRPLVS